MGFKNTYKQAGNVLFTLLGAVALGGVLTAGVAGVMRGPLSGAMNVHRQNMAEEQLSLTAKVATRVSVQQPSNGDCDADGYVEPLPFVDAGTNPKPAGGGYIPAAMGVADKDPWNRKYGYCPFDHGSVINGAGCGGAGQLRRAGTNVSKWEAFAVISAGPDGVFQTACNNWVDANTNGEPDTPLINKPQGSDDVVFTWTYEEAVAASGGLWNAETLDPNTAEVGKNISVKDGIGDEQLNFDTTSKQLTLGDGGKGSFPTVNTDSIGQLNPPLNWMDVSTGSSHTCATRTDGTLWCWGNNQWCQLGGTWSNGLCTGSAYTVAAMKQVTTDTNWSKVSLFNQGGCATKSNGQLWCWGSVPAPVQVSSGADNWAQVASGRNHKCAVRSDGTLWCWGNNTNGQYGDGTTTTSGTPVQSGAATNWARVVTFPQSTCALKTDNTLWCAGFNGTGQIGDGTTTQRTSFVQVGTGGWAYLGEGTESGTHVCAVKTNGTLWCWGYNSASQIGDGTTTQRNSPVQVGTATNWSKVSMGPTTTCAIKTDGTRWCWGANNNGQYGNGTTTASTTPTQTSGSAWSSVTTGGTHSCSLKTDGSLWCSGYNDRGQLGDGTTTNSTSPVQVPGAGVSGAPKISIGNNVNAGGKLLVNGTEVIDENGIIQHGEQDPTIGTIEGGKFCTAYDDGKSWVKVDKGEGSHTCGLRSDGTLWCWGGNSSGALGDGTTTNQNVPVQVQTDTGPGYWTDWTDISTGGSHSCGLRSNGTAWCWGYAGEGRIGDNQTATNRTRPVQVHSASSSSGWTDWTQISAGNTHTCGLRSNGTAWCWGNAGSGVLGDNQDTTNRLRPVAVNAGAETDWTQISAGSTNTCGIRSNGRAYCWGYSWTGQVGAYIINTNTVATPTAVWDDQGSMGGPTWTDWVEVSTGNAYNCGRRATGNIYCWGSNPNGQMGTNNAGGYSSTPVNVHRDVSSTPWTDWVKISTGGGHTCGVRSNGTAWCWGLVSSGQVGDGQTATNRLRPVQVSGGNADWTDISSGYQNTCGIRSGISSAWCWGAGSSGQLGNGTTPSAQSTPVEIPGVPSTGLKVTCSTDAPSGITPIQNGFTTTATEGAGCAELGELRKDVSGNLLVCDDNGTSQIDGGTCSGFEPGALSFDTGMVQYFCADNDGTYVPSSACSLDGVVVYNGSSYTFYSAPTHANCASISLSRTCNTGTLSGSSTYNRANCTPIPLGAYVTAGFYHTCQIKSNGRLYCWGDNGFRQLGDGTTTTPRNTPVAIGSDTDFQSLNPGAYHNCAVKTDGTMWCWGYNAQGQLGNGGGGTVTVPTQVGADTNWAEIRGGYNHTCGKRTDGTMWCWGDNQYGQVGDGTTSTRTTPVQVGTGTNWASFKAGQQSNCGVKTDGTLWCWGKNQYGEVGDGTTTQRTSPVQVGSATDWAQVAAMYLHTCAIKTNGTLWCWGYNANGQVGDGTTTSPRTSPVQVGSATNWVSAAVTQLSTCGRKADGTLWCWGNNTNGAVGDGTFTDRTSPVQVGTGTNWTAVEGGSVGYFFGKKSDDTFWAWGYNFQGVFGNGVTGGSYNTPQNIPGL